MATANGVDSCLLGRWVRSGLQAQLGVEPSRMKRELGGGRRLGPRRLQVEEVRRLAEAGGGGAARSGSGIVARGRAEALSGEEEVAEAAGAREVGCDAGVVLDGSGGRRRRAPPRLGDGREPGTGEPGSGVAAARLSSALVRGWG